MTDEKKYLTQVERVMEQLRARCLGQDTRLTALLPPHAREKDAQYQAKYLAAQLQFALVHAEEGRYIEPKELQRCRQWLEEIILYLLEKVQDVDHTFCSLVRMVNLPQETRRLVLHDFLNGSSDILTATPPSLLKNLDAAIWWLLGVQEKQRQARELLQKIREMR